VRPAPAAELDQGSRKALVAAVGAALVLVMSLHVLGVPRRQVHSESFELQAEMRRAIIATAGTVVGLVAVLGYRSSGGSDAFAQALQSALAKAGK